VLWQQNLLDWHTKYRYNCTYRQRAIPFAVLAPGGQSGNFLIYYLISYSKLWTSWLPFLPKRLLPLFRDCIPRLTFPLYAISSDLVLCGSCGLGPQENWVRIDPQAYVSPFRFHVVLCWVGRGTAIDRPPHRRCPSEMSKWIPSFRS
jgi:hypothetical protein